MLSEFRNRLRQQAARDSEQAREQATEGQPGVMAWEHSAPAEVYETRTQLNPVECEWREKIYQQLLKDDGIILKADLLASRDVVLKPGGDVNLDMPMEEEAQFVAVVGLFRHPDMDNNTWRLTMGREELDPDKARVIEAGNNHLTLLHVKDK